MITARAADPAPADPPAASTPSDFSEAASPTTPAVPAQAEAPPPPPKEKKKADPPSVAAAIGKGITVTSADEKYAMNIRARIVPRVDVELPPPNDEGEIDPKTRFTINTARLWVSGHLFSPKLQYTIQLAYAARDYRDGTVSPLYDAFLDYKAHRDASLKVGQYFVTFDRLRTVREFALQMTDRPRPVGELTLDRDVGVTLYSDHLGHDRSPVAYRVGVFGGAGIGALTTKPAGAMFVGRVELRPLGDIDDDSEGDLDNRKRPGLALGGAVAYNLNTIKQKSTTGTTYVGGTTDYLHAAADLVFKYNGFALQGEYLYKDASADTIRSTAADGTELVESTRSGQGWVVQGSYHFTPGVELVVRGSKLYAFEGTDPKWVTELETKGNEVGAGLNWYRNGHRFKAQATWIALFGEDFSAATHTVAAQLDVMF
jgi:hypothetical protein